MIDILLSERFNFEFLSMSKKSVKSSFQIQWQISLVYGFKYFHCQVYVLLPFERQQSRFSFCETEV